MPIIKPESSMKVALVQMQSQLDIGVNFREVCRFIEEAVSAHQAELIIFPENFLCMGAKHYWQFASQFDLCVSKLSELAKSLSVALVLGSIPVPVNASSTKCVSRSMLILSTGEQVACYDKVHLFDVQVADEQGSYRESDSFQAGNRLCVYPVNSAQLGMSICYDLRFPGLYQGLRKEGADMIAVPSAFTYTTGKAHWEVLLRARAIETQCFILAANQCGEHPHQSGGLPRKTWGHSMIIDPWGEILGQLDSQPGICSAILDFEKMRSIRQSIPVMQHKCF